MDEIFGEHFYNLKNEKKHIVTYHISWLSKAIEKCLKENKHQAINSDVTIGQFIEMFIKEDLENIIFKI